MSDIIKTKRLILRKLTTKDSQLMFELCRDPDVMKYIRNVDTDISESEKKTNEIFKYQKQHPELGLWFAFDNDEQCIGFVILLHIEHNPQNPIEIGYRIHKKFWGQGFATEMAIAIKQHAQALELNKVCGITIDENINSQKVLKKIGMNFIDYRTFYNVKVKYFEVEL